VTLLTRDAFREGVFQRDNHLCVVPGCGKHADDAHHIIERRLWTDPKEKEGYFLDNGASLCEWHHRWGAEKCAVQPSILRQYAHIGYVVLPFGWDRAKSYDKWGVELKRPTRERTKNPSTPYLPMSPGHEENDVNLPDLKPFLNQPLVITIKMDGSNTLVTRDLVAARNGNHADHPSFALLKAMHSDFGRKIPEGVQIFGEWLFAKHSIHYTGDLTLNALFQPFGVYFQRTETFGGWDDVVRMAELIGFPTTPVLDRNLICDNEWELRKILDGFAKDVVKQGHEGLVVRTMYPFPYANFEGYETTNGKTTWRVSAIGKWVRANHVQTDDHWSHRKVVKNEVK